MYLFMALFWLALGLGMLLVPLVAPQVGRFQILDTGISFGWLVLAFSGFNLLKWWLMRRLRSVNLHEQALQQVRNRRRRESGAYDPTFDFSESTHGPSQTAENETPG